MAIPIHVYILLNHDISPMLISYISLYISTPFGAVPLTGAYYLLYTIGRYTGWDRRRTARPSRRPTRTEYPRPRPLRAIRPRSDSTAHQYRPPVRNRPHPRVRPRELRPIRHCRTRSNQGETAYRQGESLRHRPEWAIRSKHIRCNSTFYFPLWRLIVSPSRFLFYRYKVGSSTENRKKIFESSQMLST